MANYASLKSDIAGVIRTNHNEEITGDLLQEQLFNMVEELGAGYQYMGVATVNNPGTDQSPDFKCFYIASAPGTYSHLGGLVVNDGEVAILKYDTQWRKDVTGAATAAKLTELGQKIDEFSQGKFYGYFSDADELPTGGTESGFAYVGTAAPFAIYNFDGSDWSDSGLTINEIPIGNGEDIDTNADGKLQFANRSAAQGQMGYKILRPDSSFAEQVTDANTIYEIRYPFDLNGASVTIPAGCVLKFVGGSISGGNIAFQATKIDGKPSFINCTYSGNIAIDKIEDADFSSNDDDNCLSFLLSNAIRLGVCFGVSRNYTISTKYLCDIEDIDSGAEIDFRGHTITFTTIGNYGAIKLVNVTRVGFYNVNVVFPPDGEEESNGHFIKCLGDCGFINLINATQQNGDTIFRSGVYIDTGFANKEIPRRGIYSSRFKIASNGAQTGITIQTGDDLNIDCHVRNAHRGIYLAGLSNSKVYYDGDNIPNTQCHTYLKDCPYYRRNPDGTETLDMKGCSSIDLKINAPNMRDGERAIVFASYGAGLAVADADFTFRSSPCKHSKIRVFAEKVDWEVGATGQNGIMGVSFNEDTQAHEVYGTIIEDVAFYDFNIVNNDTYMDWFNCRNYMGVFKNVRYINCKFNPNFTNKHLRGRIRPFGGSTGDVLFINSDVGGLYPMETPTGIVSVKGIGSDVYGGISSPNGLLSYVVDDIKNVKHTTLAVSPTISLSYKSYGTMVTRSDSLADFKADIATWGDRLKFIEVCHEIDFNSETIVLPSSTTILGCGGRLYNGTLDCTNLRILGAACVFTTLTKNTRGAGYARPTTPSEFEQYWDRNIRKPIFYNSSNNTWYAADGAYADARHFGTTAQRPSPTMQTGFLYFDTDLGKAIISNGTTWVNMDGTALT